MELGNGNRTEMLRYRKQLRWCHFSSPSLASAATWIFVEFDFLGACKKLMFWLLYLRTAVFYRCFVHIGCVMLTRDSCLLCGSECCAAHYIARLTLTLDLLFVTFKVLGLDIYQHVYQLHFNVLNRIIRSCWESLLPYQLLFWSEPCISSFVSGLESMLTQWAHSAWVLSSSTWISMYVTPKISLQD